MTSQKNSDIYWKGVNIIGDPGWGDAGKGKFVDLASSSVDMNIRFNGGANAGHTVMNEHGETKLHVVPSSIFHPYVLSVIAPTVVVDPLRLTEELIELQKKGVKITPRCFMVDKGTHMVMPWHKALDGARDATRRGGSIGTTRQGIGPTYADRVSRSGLRIEDLIAKDFTKKFKNELMKQGESVKTGYDTGDVLKKLIVASEVLKPYINYTLPVIWSYERKKKNILGESAQGGLLDLDLGGYPYVTSSNPGVSGFLRGTAIDRHHIDKVIGVMKAYTTRVGEGPMPTEQHGKFGVYLQTVGKERGATTGRTRRCGWLDIPAMRYGAKVLGTDRLILTKLDVLDELDEILICVGYRIGNKEFDMLPYTEALEVAKPVYIKLKGWQKSILSVADYHDLPVNARLYVEKIEKLMKLPIDIVSNGPHRDSTIYRSVR